MSDSLRAGQDEEVEREQERFHQAIGECLMTWAGVEFNLLRFLGVCFHNDRALAAAVWSSVISFDGKMTLLHNIFKMKISARDADKNIDDWNLIHTYTRQMSRRRNEIAHASLINHVIGSHHLLTLTPFFVPGPEGDVEDALRRGLLLHEVRERAESFRELGECLNWCYRVGTMDESNPERATLEAREPPLLQRLRDAEKQRRDEQRRRDQASKAYSA